MSSPFPYDLPAGTSHGDPSAPWNQPDGCETCDGTGFVIRQGDDNCLECEGNSKEVCPACDGLGRGKTRAELRAEAEEAKADMAREDE